MSDDDRRIDREISVYSAFLDFYSRRADIHVSLFLASFFGIFLLLSIVSLDVCGNNKIWWNVPFLPLVLLGAYELMNFSYYASYSHEIELKIKNLKIVDIRDINENLKKKKILSLFIKCKKSLFKTQRIYVFGIGYFFIILVSWILVFL